jgi:ATP-dependent DNA helicase RecG
MQRIFLSSVQREFADERAGIRDFIHGDALYLNEVRRCELFVGLLGEEYGSENSKGVSPTDLEFEQASTLNKIRLIFVKDVAQRNPKARRLLTRVEAEVVRRKFRGKPELIAGLYAALVQHLEDSGKIRNGPFDAAPCPSAKLVDLDPNHITSFLKRARAGRNFPLPESTEAKELMAHLNLLDDGQPTNAAMLLFGRSPQRSLLSSEVKCAHYHGTEVSKPIPSYQVYRGTVFEMVDQAVDFVLSKINLAVGTRAKGAEAPVSYEIPSEVVREAIVNAVAHRDYTSAGSVQVMLFEDRLEVWNPGFLPPSLTLEMLRTAHGSVPANPLLAESLYLAKYIERMGTGTRDMITRCRDFGLKEPDFEMADGFVVRVFRPDRLQSSKPMVSASGTKLALSWHQVLILRKCLQESPLTELLEIAGRSDRTKFRNQVLKPMLTSGLIKMTLPDKPTSSNQKYLTTELGEQALTQWSESGDRE